MKGRIRKMLALVMVIVMSISLIPSVSAEAALKKVKLNKTKVTIYVGKTVQLKLKKTTGR